MSEIYKGIGLKQGEVALVPIDIEKWKLIFRHEEGFLNDALNKTYEGDDNPDFKFEAGKNVKIIHSGSTSFNNVKAKPILDVLIGFSDKYDLLRAKERILENNVGTIKVMMTPRAFGFYLLGKLDGDKVVAHYHLSIRGSRAWKEHNDILYMLRKNWKILREYEQLKEDLSVKFKNNRLAYTTAKKEFLHAVIFRKQIIDQRNLLSKYSR
jgi:GrpB-like predicted nucleotidyltransferase (UPF0157 family)